MKIIISVNTSWNIYNFRLGLLKNLQQDGHEIVAIAPTDDYVTKLEDFGIKCFNIKLNSKGTNAVQDLNLIYQYYKLFNLLKPDCILSFTIKPNIYGNFAARLLNIPTINNISGLGTLFIRETLATFIGKLLYRLSLSSSHHVFFQNNDDKSLFIKNKLVRKDITSVIPGSGVDINKFNFNRTQNKAKFFLFVGRLIADKGVFEYLDAAVAVLKKYPKNFFLLVGELGYNNKTAISNEELEKYTNKYSQIKFLGKADDIVGLLKSIDVMVLPSYREGLSKSLIEAASMSLPIITTDVPGCRDVVQDNYNGFLCKVKSSDSLSKTIIKMIELDPNKRLQMGLNGRKLVKESFKEKIVINQYHKIINSI